MKNRNLALIEGTLISLIFLSLILISNYSFSCTVDHPEKIAYFGSYTSNRLATYFEGKTGEPGAIIVSGCKPTNQRYLMVAIGAEHSNSISEITTSSYDGIIETDKCVIKNNPLKNIVSDEEKVAFYKQKHDFLQKCVEIQVTELENARIQYPTPQANCTVKQISDRDVIVSGGYCFFQINFKTRMQVRPYLKKECINKDFLKANGINPMDVPAMVRLYLSGDASGLSTILDQIAAIPARFTIEPGAELMRVSEDLGDTMPRWPTEWAPDVHFGSLALQSMGQYKARVDVAFVADNNCKEKCIDGLCASPCDYATPIAAELSLKKINLKKKREDYLDSWYQGGVAFARWQGIIRGFSHYVQGELEIGATYKLEALFREPRGDFSFLKDTLKQIMIDVDKNIGIPGKDKIRPINLLPLLPDVPNYPEIPKLGATSSIESDPPLIAFKSYYLSALWPPFYDYFCSQDFSVCNKINTKANILLSITFKMKALDENKNYIIEILNVKRESTVLPNYSNDNAPLPELVCE